MVNALSILRSSMVEQSITSSVISKNFQYVIAGFQRIEIRYEEVECPCRCNCFYLAYFE